LSQPLPTEIWDIEKLKPYENNAKLHDEKQIAKLANSIKQFGWTQPIVVWKDGSIIIGHGRRLAALKLGLKKVPVVVRSDLTKAEADALRLADNRVTSVAYDMDMISSELKRLQESLASTESNLTLFDTGFDENELNFAIEHLGEISDLNFVDDIGSAVEEQAEQNRENVAATDDIMAPVADALGFKRVTIAQSRQIHSLMSRVETKTGKKGPDALIEILDTSLSSEVMAE